MKTQNDTMLVFLVLTHLLLFFDLLLLYQVHHYCIVSNTLQLLPHNLLHVRFDIIVVQLYLLLHPVCTVPPGKVANDRNDNMTVL